ncbi:MAG: glutamine-hydrolyzing GMP synthase [Ignavibacteria bacterium]|nr:glutamine-hydrolyzing GMP synthase [Ignavibacteria bacterium]
MTHSETFLILDFGSQYTQLIARRIRELGVYSEIQPFNFPLEKVRAMRPVGIVLSGGPSSVYERTAPQLSKEIFDLQIPILGICYGLQLIAHGLGGQVDASARREYGRAELNIDDHADLFHGIGPSTTVWMSHGDALATLPRDFEPIAHTENSPICSIRNSEKKIFGVQFHPEVVHTAEGKTILSNFVFRVCGATGDWTPAAFIEKSIRDIRERVGKSHVLCALSGGVDSSVVAILIHRAVGAQLHCLHIDNGLMRKDESRDVVAMFRNSFQLPLTHVDASGVFLSRLKGVVDPEQKRKIIGKTFIDVFDEESRKLEQSLETKARFEYLAQGTLYPDVIESVSFKGPSVTIKTHHNVGGLPEKMNFQLLEPFRELFKDEVREVGRRLGLPEGVVSRHPFPGPGLAVRILGDVTSDKLQMLREADEIFIQEIRNAGLYDNIWQAFAVLLPVSSVGVMGDSRTYESTIALRAVTSVDGMTADWAHIPNDVLAVVSSRITNELKGINRVVYDISSKPPATIEWE